MRSGSTLLLHLLCNNDGIAGLGEMHYKYKTVSDIYGVTSRIVSGLNLSKSSSTDYFLDKLLHEKLVGDFNVINQGFVKIIILLREPGAALSSIVKLDMIKSPVQARDHYLQQLQWIQRMTNHILPDRWTYTTYERLIDNTDEELLRLTQFLDLKVPLEKKYSTLSTTGITGLGDPGPNIHTGVILKSIKRSIDQRIEPYIKSARQAYDECIFHLSSLQQ